MADRLCPMCPGGEERIVSGDGPEVCGPCAEKVAKRANPWEAVNAQLARCEVPGGWVYKTANGLCFVPHVEAL